MTVLMPTSVADLGIEPSIPRDLVLKLLYYRARVSRSKLVEELKVPGTIVEELVSALTADSLATVLGTDSASGTGGYVYGLTQKGLERAEHALSRSGYVGPIPVSLNAYV